MPNADEKDLIIQILQLQRNNALDGIAATELERQKLVLENQALKEEKKTILAELMTLKKDPSKLEAELNRVGQI